MLNYAWLVPVFPLIGFIILIFFGYRLKAKAPAVSISMAALSALFSIFLLIKVILGQTLEANYPWIKVGEKIFNAGFVIDPLSAMMLATVGIIATLIQIYSIGYMHGDKRYSRFFAYMSLFLAAMLGLIIANNFIQLYICWELVGLCSYLLISFWFEKPSAALAGKKAFIVTRIGDTGFFLGILLLFATTGYVGFTEIFNAVQSQTISPVILTISAVLLFCGAIGKSAQFPLHVWLPDAMEGPTPVSALIHAATMVAAGVYMVARLYTIFSASTTALAAVAWIGVITLLLAGSIALVMDDIKKVIAYSTISQLGYMMMGLGVGGYTAGVFHLMTHAFFKALLFLCAGSVIHGVHTQDIKKMGNLRAKMPVTFIAFLVGGLALAGIPPFSGFFSKDEILIAAFDSNKIIYGLALLGVLFTALYTFRLIFLVFLRRGWHEEGPDAHESSLVMTVPLIILSFFAAFIGLLGIPKFNLFHEFIHFGHEVPTPNYTVMFIGLGTAVIGIIIAWIIYGARSLSLNRLKTTFAPVYNLLKNKYYFDEMYDYVFVKTTTMISGILALFDKTVVDGVVNLAGYLIVVLSNIQKWIDVHIIDGMVNLSGWITAAAGNKLKYIQTGFIQNYTFIIFAGILIIIIIRTAF